MKEDAKFSWWQFARQNYVESMMVGFLLYEYLTFYTVFRQLGNFKSIFESMSVDLNRPLQMLMAFADFSNCYLPGFILLSAAIGLCALLYMAHFYRAKLASPERDYWQAYGIVPLIGAYLFVWAIKWLIVLGPMYKVNELIQSVG